MSTNASLKNENEVCEKEKLDCVTPKLGHESTDHQIEYFTPPRAGEIGVDKKFRWFLDGEPLREREMIEIRIDGHWILGVIVKSENTWAWSSWSDMVSVHITFGLKARLAPQSKNSGIKP